MKQTPIRPISQKRQAELERYYPLVIKLRKLCGNRSELSFDFPDWQSKFLLEPHHIEGRIGKRLLDPFNIILATRNEHTAIEEERSPYTKEQLLEIVKAIRIKQGFKEVQDG